MKGPRPYQQEVIDHIVSLGGFTLHIRETVDVHRVTTKTGFAGRMNKHSAGMQTYRTLNLDPTEWRRT